MQFRTDELLSRYWVWYFDETDKVLDAELYVVLVRLCSASFSEENGYGVIETTYADLGRHCRKDWRSMKRSLTILEDCGLLKTRKSGKGVYVILLDAVVYNGKTSKMYDSMKKEDKKKKKVSPPHTPSLYKEERKEERGVGENARADRFSLSLEKRKEKFMQEVAPFVAEYGRETCNEFFSSWTELTPDGQTMRFELERTWETAKRLAKWKGYDRKFKTGTGHTTAPPPVQDPERIKEDIVAERLEEQRNRYMRSIESCPKEIYDLSRANGCDSGDAEGIAVFLRKACDAGFLEYADARHFREWDEWREDNKKKLGLLRQE